MFFLHLEIFPSLLAADLFITDDIFSYKEVLLVEIENNFTDLETLYIYSEIP
jgi:hypothetical protein